MPFYAFHAGLTSACNRAFVMKEVFTGEEIGPFRDYCNPTVGAHDCKIYRGTLVRV